MSAPHPSSGPSEGTPPSSPDMDEALRRIRSLTGAQYDVFGPLGRDRGGEFVFLARDVVRDRLVALKRNTSDGDPDSTTGGLRVLDQLDSSVPPPAGSCPACQTPFANWDPSCWKCGADIAGGPEVPSLGSTSEHLLESIKQSVPGYQVLGSMPRAAGGRWVYFARDLAEGDLVALRLDQQNAAGPGPRYTVAATRMIKPELPPDTVEGNSSPEAGLDSGGSRRPWTSVPSPAAPNVLDPFRTPNGIAFLSGSGASEKVCPQCGEAFGPELRFCPRDGAALRPKTRPDDLVGQIVAERYHILSKLGEGGMGMVYLAEHIRMERRCAIKVMNSVLLHDPEAVIRFNREAANASRINHPNVAAVYDFGETSNNIVYLVMELVEGESLAATLAREHALPEQRTVEIGRQVAEALSAAHELGIVHRDLKPDNIMLTRSRSGHDLVKVVDFGIAKATQRSEQDVTRTGFVIGTPAYMSPEQVLGDPLDGRSDIYSMGCILYEMLTGEPAFASPSGEALINKRLTQPPPRPSRVRRGLSKKLDGIVTTAMARSPDERYQSVAALRDALAAISRESPARSGWHRWLPWDHSSPVESPGEPSTDDSALQLAGSGGFGGGALPSPAIQSAPRRGTEAVEPRQRLERHTTVRRPRSSQSQWRKLRYVVALGGGILIVALLLVVFPRSPKSVTREIRPASLPDAPTPEISPAPVTPPDTAQIGQRSSSGALSSPDAAPTRPVTARVTAGEIRFTPPPPPGARLTLDGKAARLSSRGTLTVLAGRHTIKLRAGGFQPVAEVVDVVPGETIAVSLELREAQPAPVRELNPPAGPAPSLPTTGSLTVEGVLPPGAEIAVDGQPMESGTRTAIVDTGSHWVRISAAGFRPDSHVVQVTGGEKTQWSAPELEALPKLVESTPVPSARPRQPPPSRTPAPVETVAPRAPAPVDYASEVKQLLTAYAGAINARDIVRLKGLYPTMPPEREHQWRDLFRDEVKSLRATLSVSEVKATGSSPVASFSLLLSFKPDRGEVQAYSISNQATLARTTAGKWQFVHLVERGE